MRRLLPALLALPLVLVMAACGSDEDPTVTSGSGDPTTPTTPDATGATVPTGTDATPSTTRGPLTTSPLTVSPVTTAAAGGPAAPATPVGTDEETAVADLAVREGVDPSAITVVSVDNVTWRNSSIGCPEPGMNYLQSLVDGVRVVLELDGATYQYHRGGSQPLFYCATPEPPVGE
jgi:hypothetical protein